MVVLLVIGKVFTRQLKLLSIANDNKKVGMTLDLCCHTYTLVSIMYQSDILHTLDINYNLTMFCVCNIFEAVTS